MNTHSNPADTYLQEAEELLFDIESSALSLSSDPGNADLINRLFRAFHTIKGSGAMFGFAAVASFTHHVETLLDQVRENLLPATPALAKLILAAADHIKFMLQASQSGQTVDEAAQSALLADIQRLSSPVEQSAAGPSATADSSSDQWTIYFRPDPRLLAQGANPLLLFRDLEKLGPCVVSAHVEDVPDLDLLDTDTCYLRWTIQLKAKTTSESIQDVFLFVADGGELRIESVELSTPSGAVSDVMPAAAAVTTPPDNAPALAAQLPPREASVRVPAARLDQLVNLVGELVMNHSRLATAAAQVSVPELAAPIEEIERLVAQLRDDVLQIRMMPISSIFGRFQRLVHDLSHQLGKQIRLVTEGEDTELDKSILDQLGEPLVHLLRNSVDHGIETPDVRTAQGKSPQGTIRLIALHRGSDVVVSIEDDGKGLHIEAIRAKAIARQLISPEAALTDKEIYNLILLPGFSTAQTVTSISGRGVGMDVVKRQIDALRGSLSIASEPGRGSCISLTLPLTLAIIEGLLVEAADSQYVIPMSLVTENVELPAGDRQRNNGRNVIAVRGELLPYIDLRTLFRMPGVGAAFSKIVLVQHEDQRIGLMVDRVIGVHQTVIQTLGPFLRNIEVFSGSTIMGDGRVALILDIAGIVRLANDAASAGRSKAAA